MSHRHALRRPALALTSLALLLSGAALLPSAAHADAAPANDDLANARAISGFTTVDASNVGATVQPGETLPDPSYTTARTIWFSWTAPSSGPVLFDLGQTTDPVDTTLAVYTLSGKTLTPAGFDDDYPNQGVLSAVPVAVTSGTTYYLQVGGYNDQETGALKLAISPITTGLTGLVTTSTGAPVAGACVRDSAHSSSRAITNAAGRYVLAQAAGSDTPTASNCLGGANLVATTTAPPATTVADGAVASSDPIVVSSGATLTGRIIDQHGAPVADADVNAYGSGTGTSVDAVSDATGHYVISGLPADAYGIEASDQISGLYDATLANPVAVGASGTVTAPDLQVSPQSRLTGTVTATNGSPANGACVTVYAGPTVIGTPTQTSSGYYSILVPPGSYQVQFMDACVSPLATDWFNGVTTQAAATTLTVTPGEELVGVNGDLRMNAVPAPKPVVTRSGSAFVTPQCVAAQKAAGASAGPIAAAQAAVSAANAALAKDTAALAKLTKQVKKAKKKHASKKALKKLAKKVTAAKRTIAADRAAIASASASYNNAVSAGGQAGAAVAAAC